MGDKRKFKIGQVVEVNLNYRVIANYTKGGKRVVMRKTDWEGYNSETNDLVLAKVTGVKTFQLGQHHAGSSWGYEYEAEPAYLAVSGQVDVWAVRLGYKNKEIYFFEKDIVVTPANELVLFGEMVCVKVNLDIPYFWNGGWSEELKKRMSRESKDWPRDKRGRWSRDPKCHPPIA